MSKKELERLRDEKLKELERWLRLAPYSSPTPQTDFYLIEHSNGSGPPIRNSNNWWVDGTLKEANWY